MKKRAFFIKFHITFKLKHYLKMLRYSLTKFFSRSSLLNKDLYKLFHEMHQGIINKDMELIDRVLDDSFEITHLTGSTEKKKEYMKSIESGVANDTFIFPEKTFINVNGDKADLIGKSRVKASNRNKDDEFNLELSMKALLVDGEWKFTEAKATTI